MSGYWSQEAREAARQRILKHKLWERATGPQTEQGKAIASKNSTNFVNQIKQGLWVYLPNHKVFVRTDIPKGAKLLRLYQENNWLYGDRSFLVYESYEILFWK